MTNQKNRKNPNFRKYAFFLIIALLSFYVLIPQLNSFNDSIKTIINADLTYLVWATALFICTYFAATVSYCLITYFKLRYWPTFLVQVADGFTNRIIPAGFGAVATNALYLTKQIKSKTQASYLALLNNFIGFVAHVILLACLLIIYRKTPLILSNVRLPKLTMLGGLIALTVLAVGFLYWRQIKKQSVRSYKTIAKVLQLTFDRPFKLTLGLLAAMLVTSLYGLTLYCVMLALNVHLTIVQAFLVLTVSVVALTITPTPGGLGGVEAGLVAAMVSFGVNSSQALSVALVYRLITYWLPIIPGALALQTVTRRGYLAGKIKF
jgi:uncharacterized protein (TIRG00374 family)